MPRFITLRVQKFDCTIPILLAANQALAPSMPVGWLLASVPLSSVHGNANGCDSESSRVILHSQK